MKLHHTSLFQKANYVFVIQTNNQYRGINQACLNTFIPHVLKKGYDLLIIDYTLQPDKNFFQLLQDIFDKFEYSRIILSFDDLYFTYLDLISHDDLKIFINEEDYDFVRLNARPHGVSSQVIGSFVGQKYLKPKDGKYMYSTVLSALSQNAVQIILQHGIKTPWQLENQSQHIMSVAVLNRTTARFLNIVIKGKLDVFAIAQISNLRVSILGMLLRLLRRIPLIDRCCSNIAIYKDKITQR